MRLINASRLRVLMAPLLLMGLLAGCASLPFTLAPPKVSLVDLKALPAGVMEQRFQLTLRLSNPNNQVLPLNGLDVALAVNDSDLVRALSSETVVLPRLGEELLVLEAKVSTIDLIRQGLRLASSNDKAINYRLHGKAFVQNLSWALPFEHRGELDWPPQREQ